MRKFRKCTKLLPQNTFCPLPGEITNCLLITVTNERFFFFCLLPSGVAGQGRAGQGEKINDFCALTVGNLSFSNPRRSYSNV
jgi:hypothetical protein